MANFFYILAAPSAVGKSDLLRRMESEGLWKSIAKYSTRDVRYKSGEKDDVVPIDDQSYGGLSVEEAAILRRKRIDKIKKICGDDNGIVYYKNGNLYGIRVEDVENGLKTGNVVAIISDFKSIRALKENSRLKNRVVALYIASTIDERVLLNRFKERETVNFNTSSNESQVAVKRISAFSSMLGSAVRLNYLDRVEKVMPLLNEEWNAILPYFETIKNRGANISKLYYQYIENIVLIDHAILNFYDLEYMYEQCRNIIRSNNMLSDQLPEHNRMTAPVFMVCAAPSSGKKTLMEIIGDLGEINNDIRITTKYAKREKKTTDGRDGMIAIGRDGIFEKYIDGENNIWKWDFHTASGDQTWYAVNKAEIAQNINNGIAQIFISNMGQIDEARRLFPNNVVVLYLHAAHETETRKHIEEKVKESMEKKIANSLACSIEEASALLKRSSDYSKAFIDSVQEKENEIKGVHLAFVQHIHQIDHVLLNTGTREDLVNQMQKLIEYYK